MRSIERFEDILAWQRAKELSTEVYTVFEGIRDYGFKGQIERAAVSVMNNIAEGFERQSNKEFKQFLYIQRLLCGGAFHAVFGQGLELYFRRTG